MSRNEEYTTEARERPLMEKLLLAAVNPNHDERKFEEAPQIVKYFLMGCGEPESISEEELHDMETWIEKYLAE